MQLRVFISNALGCLAGMNARIARQMLGTISGGDGSSAASLERSDSRSAAAGVQTVPPDRNTSEIIESVFKGEKEQKEIIMSYAPIVETYVQEQKANVFMGTVPKNDLYFLGQADFGGKRMKVHSMPESTDHVVVRARRIPADGLSGFGWI